MFADGMVGATGVEPARIAPQDPKSCASASSATRPRPGHILRAARSCKYLLKLETPARHPWLGGFKHVRGRRGRGRFVPAKIRGGTKRRDEAIRAPSLDSALCPRLELCVAN